MLRRAVSSIAKHSGGAKHHQQWRRNSSSSFPTPSSFVKSWVLRSLKDHYLQASNMSPPPKVSPPAEFTIIKGALENYGPVLKRQYKNEEISVSVMRLADIGDEQNGEDDGDDNVVNQLLVHVDVTKPGKHESLSFLCGLYPDALGIHSVTLRPKTDDGFVLHPNKLRGRLFEELDENTRDAFHNYVEERGINESLFPFLQAWLYVKDSRHLLRWFKSVGYFISGIEAPKNIEPKAAAGEAS